MSPGARARTRERIVRRAALIAGGLALLTLLLLVTGHWILAVIFGIAAVVAGWFYLQARAVR